MKSKTIILITVLLMSIAVQLKAQTDSTIVDSSVNNQLIVVDTSVNQSIVADSVSAISGVNTVKQQIPLNLIKINLAALLFKSYSIQYERVLNRKFSIAVQYIMMPETGIPFKSTVLKLVGDDDPDTKKIIEDFKMSNFAITPEVRLYLSRKGYGRGFYIAPFYRYASFTSSALNVFYTDDNSEEQSLKLSGKLTGNTFGLAMGVQSALGKHLVLDISFLGPHFGSAKGMFSGTSSKPLSAAEQDDLRQQLEDIDIPLTEKTVNVNSNSASLNIDGPWAGYRFTIGLGVRF